MAQRRHRRWGPCWRPRVLACYSDGGGKRPAATKPIIGFDAVRCTNIWRPFSQERLDACPRRFRGQVPGFVTLEANREKVQTTTALEIEDSGVADNLVPGGRGENTDEAEAFALTARVPVPRGGGWPRSGRRGWCGQTPTLFYVGRRRPLPRPTARPPSLKGGGKARHPNRPRSCGAA